MNRSGIRILLSVGLLLAGDAVTGTYADVPAGGILDSGPVVWKLTPTSGGISLVRTDPLLETGFAGTLLTPCALA